VEGVGRGGSIPGLKGKRKKLQVFRQLLETARAETGGTLRIRGGAEF